ncbi:hypothetical protein QQF64_011226 [Cirrhinus molitorella]|uniref:Secreted protein n=1 Tax=Cirrhinus molitorella TaxID=172907 RepID=A0ABR3M2B1_9TELE
MVPARTTAQAMGRSMASLVVLERLLWLSLTEIKEADKVPFLDAPISPTSLNASQKHRSHPSLCNTSFPRAPVPQLL